MQRLTPKINLPLTSSLNLIKATDNEFSPTNLNIFFDNSNFSRLYCPNRCPKVAR